MEAPATVIRGSDGFAKHPPEKPGVFDCAPLKAAYGWLRPKTFSAKTAAMIAQHRAETTLIA
jgi:hypothetical protein